MKGLHYNQARFLKSVHDLSQLPPDLGAEVAFVGASNSGKSSAINAITQIKRLAKTSKTPGRTQLVNFFDLGDQRRLVDLPGYGFAKVPDSVKQHWEKMVSGYLEHRECLRGIILIMDVRHPLKPLDWQMIDWSSAQELPVHILLSKADKLKRGALQNTFFEVEKSLASYELISLQTFSAFNHDGCEDAREQLDEWLQPEE